MVSRPSLRTCHHQPGLSLTPDRLNVFETILFKQLMAYSIMGMICWTVLCALGEMATFIPHRKGFSGYATRCKPISSHFASQIALY